MRVRALLLLLLGCLPPAFADCTEPGAPEGSSAFPASDSTNIDLHKLTREVGTKIHKHFLLDPRAPRTVDLNGMDAREVTYPQLLSLLWLYGFTATEDAGILRVVPDANVRTWPMPVVPPENIQTPDDVWVTTVVPVRNISAAQLIPVLRPLMPQNAQMSAVMDLNALIIVDRSANVRRLVTVVKTLEAIPPKVFKEPPEAPQGEGERRQHQQ